MKTLKTSRHFTGSPISLRAVCKLEGRSFPAGVKDFVATDGFRNFSGQLSAGDVDCTWSMALWQNGFWSLRGDFHDGGLVGGDFFLAEFLLDKSNPIGAHLKGSILDPLSNRHSSVNQDGSDSWVRENWHRFEGSGPSVRLHAAPAVGMIIENSILLLFIAVGAAFTATEGAKKVRRFARRSALNSDPSSPPDGTQASIEVGEEDGSEEG